MNRKTFKLKLGMKSSGEVEDYTTYEGVFNAWSYLMDMRTIKAFDKFILLDEEFDTQKDEDMDTFFSYFKRFLNEIKKEYYKDEEQSNKHEVVFTHKTKDRILIIDIEE